MREEGLIKRASVAQCLLCHLVFVAALFAVNTPDWKSIGPGESHTAALCPCLLACLPLVSR